MTTTTENTAFAMALAVALSTNGETWAIGRHATDNGFERCWFTRDGDGFKLHANFNGWNNEGRARFSIAWPNDGARLCSARDFQVIAYSEQEPACTASLANAKAAAAHVRRRLVDPMTPHWAKACALVASWAAHRAEKADTRAHLARIMGAGDEHPQNRDAERPSVRIYTDGLSATLDIGGDVRAQVNGLTRDEAAALADLLATFKAARIAKARIKAAG